MALDYDTELKRLGLPTTSEAMKGSRTTYFEAKYGLAHTVSCLITLHNAGDINKATYDDLLRSPPQKIAEFLANRDTERSRGSRKCP